MNKPFIEDQTFTGINFSEEPLKTAHYEYCTFVNCDLSDTNLSENNFLECTFEGCNFSMANLNNTALRDVAFKECKLIGLHFEACNTIMLAVQFDGCQLNLACFYQLPLEGTQFKNCNLQEADFAETDLQGAVFDHCDLQGAMFENTNLEGADLRTAGHFSIDPENNRLKKAKFSMNGLVGLLGKYNLDIE